ncbi:MAG: hypothetical protein AAF202_11570 [Pseudomonadota bacterium]
MSCTYGVLAGTLVGAATLAFEDQPGDNLNKVARGASIGLYTGILLGLYVVYGVSADDGGGEEYDQYIEEGLPPVEGEGTKLFQRQLQERLQPPKTRFHVGLAPTMGENSVDGATAQLVWSVF